MYSGHVVRESSVPSAEEFRDLKTFIALSVSVETCLLFFDYQIGFEDFCCVTLNKTSLLVESDIPP